MKLADIRLVQDELRQRCPAGAVLEPESAPEGDASAERAVRHAELRFKSLRRAYDPLSQGAARLSLAAAFAANGDLAQAHGHCLRAAEVLRICDRGLAGLAWMLLGKIAEQLGPPARALEAYEQSARLFEHPRDADLLATVRGWQANYLNSAASMPASRARVPEVPGAAEPAATPPPTAPQAPAPQPVPGGRTTLTDNPATPENRSDGRTPDAGMPQVDTATTDGQVDIYLEEDLAPTPTGPPIVPSPSIQAEPSDDLVRKPTLKPGQPAFLISLIPVSDDSIAAGRPVRVADWPGAYITTDVLDIQGNLYQLRWVLDDNPRPLITDFDFGLPVIGQSMEPTIHEGEYVFVRKGRAVESEIVVARLRGDDDLDHFTIKRYHPCGNYVQLLPDNESEPVLIVIESEALRDAIYSEYANWIAAGRAEVYISPPPLVEGKVAAILSPMLAADQPD